jgi:crossover junction endodeoxyribonuclease RuvC
MPERPGTARRVLGIDPGLAVTGYGIVDGDGVNTAAVVAGVLRTRAKDGRASRLAALYARIGELIDEYHPHEVAIEQHFVAENVRSAMVIGEARAAAMLAASTRGLEVFEYPATTIKQTVAGYGAAPKEQVQRMVTMHLSLNAPPTPLDAADALAVALTRLAALRFYTMLAARS